MQILDFSEDNFASALSNDCTSSLTVKSKDHFKYFLDYLGKDGLNAKAILIEEEYISKDYLHDYASYYAFCFKNYKKTCKRVHFFQTKIDNPAYLQRLVLDTANKNSDFWSSYLGFIVVKPIPVTVVGYTVLKTYSNENRNFWGTRQYSIHIFGREIKIDSLSFQEQDCVLSACATTAIWIMLNKASLDVHTTLKSPSQITKDADKISPSGGRLFPNKGLNIIQICNAIVNSGLVSEVKQADKNLSKAKGKCISNTYLKKIVNAYSPIGIPLILIVNVPKKDKSYGLHAITVSGTKLNALGDSQTSRRFPYLSKTYFISENIEKIYAHDDQWGPFVRIGFKDDSELVTPWSIEAGLPTRLITLVVPIYPKIRISYEDIETIVRGLDAILKIFFYKKVVGDLIWDIKIEYSENFKKQIINSSLCQESKFSYVSKSLPKYVWVASCFVEKIKILDFIFDATDVNIGMIGDSILSYLPDNFKSTLAEFLNTNRSLLEILVLHKAHESYYSFFIDEMGK
ncbi:MAG: hypothetical protein AB2L20_09625 [Mangrovibacterium sp.]